MIITYGVSRNIEASTIDFITEELESSSFENVTVEKAFSKITDGTLPAVCIRLGDTFYRRGETGSNLIVRKPLLLIDIFAKSDGQRIDLKDFIISKLKGGWKYYRMKVENGEVIEKIEDGRIYIERMIDVIDRELFVENRDEVDPIDRYRHLISISVTTGKMES
jgi:hypothetical protein